MKRVLRIPPKPTKEEETLLNNHFLLPGWQFDALIGHKCTELSTQIIYWDGIDPQYAIIYGLRAVQTDTQKPCIANFFIHFGNRVFQCGSIVIAGRIPDLLRKERDWEDYQYKLWKQKKEAKKSQSKTKIKQLKPASVKVA